MGDIKNKKKKKTLFGIIKNKYVLIFLFIYLIFGAGATYAYFAFQYEEESVIVGNIVSINVDLDVELVAGSNGKLVPMTDGALSNALNGVGSTNGACIDSVGNLSCQVYKITLTNSGSRLQNVRGTIELYPKEGTNNQYSNLKWRELTNTTTVDNSKVNHYMEKSTLVSGLTMESKEVKIWYIAVWLSDSGYDQRDRDKGLFGGTVTFDVATDSVNAPNLDNGNLIPVYFDENEGTYGSWKKADSANANNSWYDYDNKMWANAIMVSDSTKRATYQSADVGTTITDSDISGFLVWIPRYKYRVWNITRQGGDESTYAYPAYTNGIEIEWENGTASTGNVECTYNIANASPSTTLSDTCVYNETTTITPTSGNTNFTDAWYTHPAFTFDTEKSGFWIGKFETTGSAEIPTVLPDTTALVEQDVSTQFTTSRVFQTYGLSSSVNAHMLTNLEWGAMAYLTHSVYGLCDGTSCRDAYINNSEDGYTGRSAGVLAPSSSYDTDTYGTYNYKGYSIDSSTGSSTSTKDTTKVASTTGNITGVYDVVGGKREYVMGNQVDKNNAFNSSFAGDNWNGLSTLSPFYYNAYSYGKTDNDQTAFNRAILGDATAEVTGDVGNYHSAWQPGTGITGSLSSFADSSTPWFIRSGIYSYSGSGSFFFFPFDGNEYSYISFRLSVS